MADSHRAGYKSSNGFHLAATEEDVATAYAFMDGAVIVDHVVQRGRKHDPPAARNVAVVAIVDGREQLLLASR